MTRYHLILEYDGSHFHGWQKQSITPTVQEVLEQAIFSYCQEKVSVVGAGRTDAGVHALGQSAHIALKKVHPATHLMRGVNAHLRDDHVVILSAKKAKETFHARFHALRRRYCYVISRRIAPPVLSSKRLWHHPLPLDLFAMENAATMMEGQHDFALFRSASCQATQTIRTMERVEITVHHAPKNMIEIRFQSRAFLQKQVRFLVGALVAIGRGKWKQEHLKNALEARKEHPWHPPPPAPPSGLYLEGVDYPEETLP